jgi:hypothetical protein
MNDNLKLDHRELTEKILSNTGDELRNDELDAVSGGLVVISIISVLIW